MMTHSIKNGIWSLAGRFLGHPVLSQPFRAFIENNELAWDRMPRLKRRRKWPFQVLLYHRVLPEFDPLTIDAVTTAEFESHIRLIARYFRPITLDQLVEEIERNELKPGAICITFDDGYQDNYAWAFPILRKYQVPATIFLTSDVIGSREMLWHDSIMYAMRHTGQARFNFPPASILDCELSHTTARFSCAIALLEWFKRQKPPARQEYLASLLKSCQVTLPDQRHMLNWDEIKEMANSGITFGGHTRSHTILALLDENAAAEEIYGCKMTIERQLKRTIKTFAYPNGKANDFTRGNIEILKSAGFRAAVTTSKGVNTADHDVYALRRSLPWDRQPSHFLARLLFERFIVS